MSNGKGSKRRKENTKRINDNWDGINWSSTDSKQEKKIYTYINCSGEETEILVYQEESSNVPKPTPRSTSDKRCCNNN
tara:strand:- start:75 stop:308 length:234 start_codon:yes stop_codon:yes gene_type:complete